MGRAGIHRVRPILLAAVEKLMKFVEGNAEPIGIAADLIERQQAIENVVRRVLQPLRHQRAGQLLKAHDKMSPVLFRLVALMLVELKEQESFDEIQFEQQSEIGVLSTLN